MSRLLWRDAQGVEGSVELGTGELLVGRALECAIRTEDAMVSRHHARVILVKGQYVVEDLGSSNGVFYQEQRIMRHPLRHGDAVRCGSLWLRFVEAPMASPHSRAPTDLAPIGSGSGLPTFAGPGGTAVPVAVHGDRTHGALLPGPGLTTTEEVPRLRGRGEQTTSEPHIYRGGAEGTTRLEQLDKELVRLGDERDRLKARVAALEATLRREGGDAMVQPAGAMAESAADVVSDLNDLLSKVRSNVTAAEAEFDEYASVIPPAAFELIREALRSSARDMEIARQLVRKLRVH